MAAADVGNWEAKNAFTHLSNTSSTELNSTKTLYSKPSTLLPTVAMGLVKPLDHIVVLQRVQVRGRAVYIAGLCLWASLQVWN